MYIHLGGEIVVKQKDVVGIFDIETSSTSQITRSYLAKAQKSGRVINVNEEMPKSFIVCNNEDGTVVYISQISTATLKKRMSFLEQITNIR